MRRKSTFRWNGMKKVSTPVAPPLVDYNMASFNGSVRATVQRRSNNLKTTVDRNSLSSTGSSSNSEEGIVLSLLSQNVSTLDDSALLESWLTNLQFEEYVPLFVSAGYDMPTISRMTPADLTAIGITKPLHRRKLNTEIQKLNITDGIPEFIPKSLLEWLKLIRLEEYFDVLCQQSYDSIDRVIQLTWEDFEEIGIKKLGHQKRLSLAIKRIQDLNNGVRKPATYSNLSSSIPSSSSLSSDSSSSSDAAHSSHHNLSLPLKNYPLSQEVAIHTSKLVSPTLESPGTPELKTFQQVSGSDFGSTSSCSSSVSRMPIASNDKPLMSDHSSRSSVVGQSIESLNRDDSDTSSKITAYLQQYISRLQVNESRQDYHRSLTEQQLSQPCNYHQGYESDCEPSAGRQGVLMQMYEYETTATLNRPRSLIKNKPVAKIVANSHQDDDVGSHPCENKKVSIIPPHVEIKTSGKSHVVLENHYNLYEDAFYSDVNSFPPPPPPPLEPSPPLSCNENMALGSTQTSSQSPLQMRGADTVAHSKIRQPASSSVSATLKKNKVPPAPPKRTNSIKTGSSNYIYSCGMNKLPLQSQDGSLMSSRCNSLDAIQERAFATCVKTLTSRFNITTNAGNEIPPLPSRNHPLTPRIDELSPHLPDHRIYELYEEPPAPPVRENEYDFDDDNLPPPPPPDEPLEYYSAINTYSEIAHTVSEIQPSNVQTSPESTNSPLSPTNGQISDREVNSLSTSSSTESMPFAHDNIGTIKQRDYSTHVNKESNKSFEQAAYNREKSLPSSPIKSSSSSSPCSPLHHTIPTHVNSPSLPSSTFAPSSASSSPSKRAIDNTTILSPSSQIPSQSFSPGHNSGEPSNHLIEDIETMLSNLSNQLDELLESEMKGDPK